MPPRTPTTMVNSTEVDEPTMAPAVVVNKRPTDLVEVCRNLPKDVFEIRPSRAFLGAAQVCLCLLCVCACVFECMWEAGSFEISLAHALLKFRNGTVRFVASDG